jgi:D-arabinose 1-dehydrogenase-like Zn-dependent alcohol dehydrogenase
MAVPGVTLGSGDVLVEVELATVCGSDVHTVLGHRDAATPLVLGHEQV